MPAPMTQKEFCQQIVMVSLAMRFTEAEEQLTLGQLAARGFAPTEAYCRSSNILLIKCPYRWNIGVPLPLLRNRTQQQSKMWAGINRVNDDN